MGNIALTRHFKKRCRSRVGVKKKNQYKFINEIIDSGEYLKFNELTGFIKEGISKIIDITRYDPVITKSNIFIVSNDGAYVTLYILPKEYTGKVNSLIKRKMKEGENNDND